MTELVKRKTKGPALDGYFCVFISDSKFAWPLAMFASRREATKYRNEMELRLPIITVATWKKRFMGTWQ